ncbi:hypothetical protein ACIBBB_29535 [Streptomyces sp. NPDC051217]|uniref:hypothetical protein n=1 Tax=Streptomyces sp. NPDC051217 TaxID=3365644 RepID=UPI00378C87D0
MFGKIIQCVVAGAIAAGGLAAAGSLPANAAAVQAPAATIACPSTACVRLASGLGEAVRVAPDGPGSAYVTYQNGDLREVDLVSGGSVVVARGLGNLRGVDVHGGSAYVVDFGGSVQRVDLGSGAREVLASGLGALQAVVHDGGSGSTYVTGGDGQLVEVRESGGAPRVVAGGLGLSQGIALDGKGNAYTADMMAGRVLRTELATGDTETLASETYEPTSISVGPGGQVYFAVADQVTRLDPATGRKTHFANIRGLNSVGFTMDERGDAHATDLGGGGSLWRIPGLGREIQG